jgi:hypothetical protein
MELVRHRQTKEAATDRFHLKPPRHIPTPPSRAGYSGSHACPLRRNLAFPQRLADRRNLAKHRHWSFGAGNDTRAECGEGNAPDRARAPCNPNAPSPDRWLWFLSAGLRAPGKVPSIETFLLRQRARPLLFSATEGASRVVPRRNCGSGK